MSNKELEQFPISADEARQSIASIAKQIHYRYRSPFALVLVLPNAIWAGKVMEEELNKDGAHPVVHGIGTLLIDTPEGRRVVVVEPPSVHGIKGKKVVLFDAQGDWHLTVAAAKYIVGMKPQTIEVAALFCKGDIPDWLNPDYIGYQIPKNVLVTGLGLGYNEEQASGGAITGVLVEEQQDTPPVVTSEDKTEEV